MTYVCDINKPEQIGRVPFLLVDSTDKSTAKTGLTPALSIMDIGSGSFVAAANGITEIGAGVYTISPTTLQTDAQGVIMYKLTGTAAIDAFGIVQVVDRSAGQTYPANMTQVNGTAQSPGDIVALVSNLSVGSAGISTTASSFTATTAGSPTNTYTATVQEDGTYHIVPPSGGNTDIYYEFNVGTDGVPVAAEWTGYATSLAATYAVYFYNWGATAFEQVGTIVGTTAATPQTASFIATIAHVGTGGDDGKVRLRFVSSTGTNIATDRLLIEYTAVTTFPTNFSSMLIGGGGSTTMNGGGLLALEATSQSMKAKTDSLTFTVAGKIDANVQAINDVDLIGAGAAGDKFRV